MIVLDTVSTHNTRALKLKERREGERSQIAQRHRGEASLAVCHEKVDVRTIK